MSDNDAVLDHKKLSKSKTHQFSSHRSVKPNDARLDYPNNKIRTSKYTTINFLPKNLMMQFTRIANTYFLINGLLSLIKEISTSNGVPLIFIPLGIIILVSMIKDISEDWKRHRADNDENTRLCTILKNGQLEKVPWQELRVGNIIRVEENEFFPADVLILKSGGKKGACFIETKNLDGETNLKFKLAMKEISDDFQTEEKMSQAHNAFDFEPPNVYLYSFNGSIYTSAQGKTPLSEQNFILRGCSLRNTPFVYGLVAYTGHHTKIMMNSIKAKQKFSKLEVFMNKQIIRVFIVQFCFCVFSGLYAAIWYQLKKGDLSYLDIDTNSAKDNSFGYNLFVRMGNWLLLFTNFVPISLLVTLEMVRLFQGVYMTNDPNTLSKAENIKTSVQSSNLMEELGQVEYVFSDKTGTLTKNIMEFKNISINGKIYGNKRDLKDLTRFPVVTNVDFKDSELFRDLEGENSPNYATLKEFLIELAVCHTIITEEKDGKVHYNASSPDELALVNFAKFVGSEFTGIDDENNLSIEFMKQPMKFKLLQILEFNSTRKRMSVIVRTPEGKIVLYCKGADSIIIERMAPNGDPNIEKTKANLVEFANVGLRTLVLAKKELDNHVYEEWGARYKQGLLATEGRDEIIAKLQEEIELGLYIVGCTAIEDKLQDDVGITIAKIKESGIKVWVLTGDKIETAINIGYSCKLLSDDLNQLQVIENTLDALKNSLDEKIEKVKNVDPNNSNFALIIAGDSLALATKEKLADKVIKIAEVCNSVLACRVSPKQKQEIVSMVRAEKPKVVTLAIGDGANDVNMIIAAHIGIGIRGLEGQQAARASDFAIGEFKILRTLLYEHGREAYRRNSYLILYNFYKNMVCVLPQFWFAFYSGFSGQTVYDQVIFQGFNIFYASLPIVIYAVLDREYPTKTLIEKPVLYTQGMKDKLFNPKAFWGWYFMGVFESFLISFWSYFVFDYNAESPVNGREVGIFGPGMVTMSIAVMVVNAKVATISNQFTPLMLFVLVGSTLFYLFCYWVGSLVSSLSVYGTLDALWGAPYFWIPAMFCSIIAFFSTVAWGRYRFLYEVARKERISPEEMEIDKMLAQTPDIEVDAKKPDQVLDHNHRSNDKKYTGYAFSAMEKIDNVLKNAEF